MSSHLTGHKKRKEAAVGENLSGFCSCAEPLTVQHHDQVQYCDDYSLPMKTLHLSVFTVGLVSFRLLEQDLYSGQSREHFD